MESIKNANQEQYTDARMYTNFMPVSEGTFGGLIIDV
jgi:hypothetical protein